MRTLALLATLTIVAMAFAGCTGDGDGDGESSSSSSSTSRSSTSATGSSTSRSSTGSSTGSATSTSTGSAPNRAPTGSLSVAVNGTNATFTLTGSDPDGDTVVWDLTFGDGAATNGTGLPANATHTYASAGNFTANFTITDGESPVAYDVVVTVAGAGGGAGPQVVTGGWTAGMMGCSQIMGGEPFSEYDGSADPLDGVAFVKFVVDPATIGKTFTMAATMTGTGGYVEIDFYNAANARITYFPPTPIAPGTTTATGEVPAGSVFAIMFPCHPAPGTFDYTAG